MKPGFCYAFLKAAICCIFLKFYVTSIYLISGLQRQSLAKSITSVTEGEVAGVKLV